PLQAGLRVPVAAAIGGFESRRIAHGAAGQVFLAIDLALQREVGAELVLALHAGLEHARFVAVLLAQAETGALAARIGEEVQLLAAMLPLHQPGTAAAVEGAALAAAGGGFGAQLVALGRAELRV